jgi:hypothetical protein
MTSLRPEEIVMVVHGAEVFDHGDVAWLQRVLSPRRILVAGVMARTAAEESGLPVEFSGEPPSVLIRASEEEVILVNRGKTPRSGQIFGEIISRRTGPGRGFFHLECSSHTLYLWNRPEEGLGRELEERTGFRRTALQSISDTDSPPYRKIRGCLPGEVVCINGLVIGRATADTVVIGRAGNTLQVISGLIPKPHGLEKLQRTVNDFDLSRLWCKSGKIRSSLPRARTAPPPTGRVAVIDHCGHDIYRILDDSVCGILAIGDDTTSVCGHIASHRGIPVFGVVDGDSDHLLEECFSPGSVIVQVDPGTDDRVGRELAEQVTYDPIRWDEWVEEMLHRLAGRARNVRKLT